MKDNNFVIFNPENTTEYLMIFFVFIVLIGFLYRKTFKGRHARNIATAKRVISKLATIEGEYAEPKIINYLKKINPFVFEELLLDAFQLKGYKIRRNKRYTGDGGIDGTIFNPQGEKILIQAKRYQNAISSRHVDDFSKLVIRTGAKTGFFVHTGRTPKLLFGRHSNVEIISGNKLVSLVRVLKAEQD